MSMHLGAYCRLHDDGRLEFYGSKRKRCRGCWAVKGFSKIKPGLIVPFCCSCLKSMSHAFACITPVCFKVEEYGPMRLISGIRNITCLFCGAEEMEMQAVATERHGKAWEILFLCHDHTIEEVEESYRECKARGWELFFYANQETPYKPLRYVGAVRLEGGELKL